MDLAYRAVDADNHYYEAVDACTRHLDKEFRHAGVQAVQQGTHTILLAGGKRFRFIPNPTFDPIIVAGCMDLMFRGQIPDGVDPRSLLKVEPLRPEYQNRDARMAVMDEQNLETVFMFPTLGAASNRRCATTSPPPWRRCARSTGGSMTTGDFDTRTASSRCRCSRWPTLTARSRSWSGCSTAARGWCTCARRRSPPTTGGSVVRPSRHDPVWARLAEAECRRVPPRRQRLRGVRRGVGRQRHVRAVPAASTSLSKLVVSDRPIHDTIGSMVVDGVFDRHPTLRVASIENGSDWVGLLVKRLLKQANQTPWVFAESPLDTIREHVWVTPYYEEDMRKLADLIGAEHVLFGSDWPHGEGLARPTDFVKELHAFSDDEIRLVMRDNALDLLRPAATA